MGLKSEVDQVWQDRDGVAYRPSQTYDLAGSPYVLFNITGGPVWLKLMIGSVTGATVAATTLDVDVSAIGAQAAGPILGATVLNGIIWVPLNVAGTSLGALALPATVATLTYMLAGIGTINVAVGGAAGSMVMDWTVVYKKLSPASAVI